MKCKNGHENPEDARFCQECGVKIQSAEEQAQEALQRLKAQQERQEPDPELKARQEALRAEHAAGPVSGSDLGRLVRRISDKQWVIAAMAGVAILASIVIGVRAGGSSGSSSGSTDSTPAEPSVVMTTSQLEGELADAQPWSGGSYASSANCIENDVRADGSGTYQCYVYWTDGSTPSSKKVVVDRNGSYMTASS